MGPQADAPRRRRSPLRAGDVLADPVAERRSRAAAATRRRPCHSASAPTGAPRGAPEPQGARRAQRSAAVRRAARRCAAPASARRRSAARAAAARGPRRAPPLRARPAPTCQARRRATAGPRRGIGQEAQDGRHPDRRGPDRDGAARRVRRAHDHRRPADGAHLRLAQGARRASAPSCPSRLRRTLYGILTQKQREKFEANLELDLSYAVRGLARFRVNIYQQRESIGAAFRVIPYEIKPLEAARRPARRRLVRRPAPRSRPGHRARPVPASRRRSPRSSTSRTARARTTS